MKRLLATLCLTLTATTAFAFDSTRRAERIAVLRGPHEIQSAMADALRRELRQRGYDAFDAERTYEEVMDDGAVYADYFVEFASAQPSTYDSAVVGVGGRHADVGIGRVTSSMHVEVRLYDAETMELIASENLAKKKSSWMPTSVGIGGGVFYAVIGLPFERAQERKVARAAAREAAAFVIGTIRGQ
ncbi:MAG TPA: hypothetical protein VEK79_09145 [Thermoanaerobaculia bacterium]|nr:hypothetical protein [Thermoanaerobaculia bacterium]